VILLENFKGLRLRFHHIVCLQGFVGYGYSDSFTRNLQSVVEKIADGYTNRILKLTFSPDEVCMLCPNLIDGMCKMEEKIIRLDKAVYRVLKKSCFWKGLKTLYRPGDVFRAVNRNSLVISRVVCRGCRWQDVCAWFKMNRVKAITNCHVVGGELIRC